MHSTAVREFHHARLRRKQSVGKETFDIYATKLGIDTLGEGITRSVASRHQLLHSDNTLAQPVRLELRDRIQGSVKAVIEYSARRKYTTLIDKHRSNLLVQAAIGITFNTASADAARGRKKQDDNTNGCDFFWRPGFDDAAL